MFGASLSYTARTYLKKKSIFWFSSMYLTPHVQTWLLPPVALFKHLVCADHTLGSIPSTEVKQTNKEKPQTGS
jgi:hypothetical protein